MEFVYVREGSFRMGAVHERNRAYPVHQVRITRGFWLGKHEVSQLEYKTLTGENPSTYKGELNPVESVCWNDAASFCEVLTNRERDTRRLPAGYEYRLPTEAEWEYAARGEVDEASCTNDISKARAQLRWHFENYGDRTHPVVDGVPTALGFYGLTGNVWEWCWDWYAANYYADSPAEDPTGPVMGTYRVCRGGLHAFVFEGICLLAIRDPDPPDNVDDFLGFRVALGPSLDGLQSSQRASHGSSE
jgi:formylglycine-generating enzyme required for sulfatase activity